VGIITADFNITDQLLTGYSAVLIYWRKNGSTMGQYISYLDLKKACDSGEKYHTTFSLKSIYP
jgi:hypothetical protein